MSYKSRFFDEQLIEEDPRRRGLLAWPVGGCNRAMRWRPARHSGAKQGQ
jgi:hypothetical protein